MLLKKMAGLTVGSLFQIVFSFERKKGAKQF
jgi:hypothetical protein